MVPWETMVTIALISPRAKPAIACCLATHSSDAPRVQPIPARAMTIMKTTVAAQMSREDKPQPREGLPESSKRLKRVSSGCEAEGIRHQKPSRLRWK